MDWRRFVPPRTPKNTRKKAQVMLSFVRISVESIITQYPVLKEEINFQVTNTYGMRNATLIFAYVTFRKMQSFA